MSVIAAIDAWLSLTYPSISRRTRSPSLRKTSRMLSNSRLTLSMSSIEAAAIRRIKEFRFSAAGGLAWTAPSDCRSATGSGSLVGGSGLRRTGGAYASGPGFCGLNWFALGQSARTTVIVCPPKVSAPLMIKCLDVRDVRQPCVSGPSHTVRERRSAGAALSGKGPPARSMASVRPVHP